MVLFIGRSKFVTLVAVAYLHGLSSLPFHDVAWMVLLRGTEGDLQGSGGLAGKRLKTSISEHGLTAERSLVR